MSNLAPYSFLQSYKQLIHFSELANEKTALGLLQAFKENDHRFVAAGPVSVQLPHFDETECSDSDSAGEGEPR